MPGWNGRSGVQPISSPAQQHSDKARCRDALDAFFAEHKAVLLNERIAKREIELEKHQQHLIRQQTELVALRENPKQLKKSVWGRGWCRLDMIRADVQRLDVSLVQKKQQAHQLIH